MCLRIKLIICHVPNKKGEVTPADATLIVYQKHVRNIFRNKKKAWAESVVDRGLRQRLDANGQKPAVPRPKPA